MSTIFPKFAEVWANVQKLMSAPSPHYGEAVNKRIEELGMAGLRLGLLLHTYQFEPAPITAHGLQYTIPYYATGPFKEGFRKLAEHDFLVGDGAYRLTEKGRRTLVEIFSVANRHLHAVEITLPQTELTRLHEILRRLDDNIRHNTSVPEKFCYLMQRQIVPANPPSLLSEISDYATGLYAFRCDCHRLSWQIYGVSGPAWESLSTIWLKEADSADTLAEKLGRARPVRGYTRDEYVIYLQELAEHGWIAPLKGGSKFELTPEGTRIRQTAEDDTDRFFYAIWSILSKDEVAELNDLTLRICEYLQKDEAERV